jgi:uncharacterized protein
VMAHETFEDAQTAALMNEHLVSIKVDREERPDVDAVYMAATQAMTGQGGWPMTVFMTPDREPFYCGTYFPREHFRRLVLAVARSWQVDRGEVTGQARRITAALAEQAGRVAGGRPGESELADASGRAVTGLWADYDSRFGGFGGAPKFPPSMVLEFLLRHSERAAAGGDPTAAGGDPTAADDDPTAGDDESASRGGAERAVEMVVGTAEAMARGGMYDQLGGGFARYSVDRGWVVPHFEKMLYDNALLARVYAHLWRRTGSELAGRVAAETCAWMIGDLGTAEGGFASALDADSEGEEGKFYVWTPGQLRAALGPADGAYAAELFAVSSAGTFEHGSSVLQLRSAPADQARFAAVRRALLDVRAGRARPGRDDKVVAAWNGLAVAALAEAGLLLDRPEFVAAARDAARLLADLHLADGRLSRTSRDGRAGPTAGVLEDYACVADAFLVLSGVTGEGRWVSLAGELLETALARFGDQDSGFYDTADDGERLIYRPADPADGPTPSGTFAVAGALLSYSALTGSARHRAAALAALGPLPAIAARFPRAAGAGLAVAEAFLSGPAEIAIVGPADDQRTRALHRTAFLAAPPGAVVALGDGSADGRDAAGRAEIPLLAGRGMPGGVPVAYVCRNFTCRAPVADAGQLRAALRGG